MTQYLFLNSTLLMQQKKISTHIHPLTKLKNFFKNITTNEKVSTSKGKFFNFE